MENRSFETRKILTTYGNGNEQRFVVARIWTEGIVMLKLKQILGG